MSIGQNILEVNGLDEITLSSLSYRSKIGKSLKKNLHYFDKDRLMDELFQATVWLDEQSVLEEIPLDYRVKSMDSIELKYERYYPDRQVRQVFNDILGFRAFCDDYEEVLHMDSDVFRVVDMSSGKSNDDGYRGVHLYYQMDNFHYPIEVQFNTYYDRQINNWLHKYLYKKSSDNSIGRFMRLQYEKGVCPTEKDFQEVLKYVLYSRKEQE